MIGQIFMMNILAKQGFRIKSVDCRGNISTDNKLAIEKGVAEIIRKYLPYDIDANDSVPADFNYWVVVQMPSNQFAAWKMTWERGSYGASSVKDMLEKIEAYYTRKP